MVGRSCRLVDLDLEMPGLTDDRIPALRDLARCQNPKGYVELLHLDVWLSSSSFS